MTSSPPSAAGEPAAAILASRRVEPAHRLRGRLAVPGDKSIAHRGLIVNALSGGPGLVEVRSPGADVQSTAACLRSLGIEVDETRDGPQTRFLVRGELGDVGGVMLDCGNAGTTMRLLAGAIAGRPIDAVLDGDASLRRRPMERVAALLRAAGADAETTDGHAPMRIRGRKRLSAASHALPVASAQLVGAAALAALGADGTTRISVPGPTRDHTERLLAAAGVAIRREGHVTLVDGPARPTPLRLVVPGDPSSAAPWLVAAAIHPDADVTISGVGLNPTRTAIVDLLVRMGADVQIAPHHADGPEPVGDIRVRGGRALAGIEVAGEEAANLIDELPLVGVLMAAASGPSRLRDATELRVKESDRIAATVAGLTTIGARVDERADGWHVAPGRAAGGAVTTHGDHRIAIAFAIAATTRVATHVELDDPACVAVSYPTFWDALGDVAS